MTNPLFLTPDEIKELSGFTFKDLQVTQLRTMGIPFRINGRGRPIVARSVIDGTNTNSSNLQQEWQPSVLQKRGKAA